MFLRWASPLYSSGWLWTQSPPVSVPLILGLQVCTTKELNFKVFFFRLIYIMYECFICMYICVLEEGIRSHYRWMWATMWLLGIELRTSGRTVGALNLWAISSAQHSLFLKWEDLFCKIIEGRGCHPFPSANTEDFKELLGCFSYSETKEGQKTAKNLGTNQGWAILYLVLYLPHLQ